MRKEYTLRLHSAPPSPAPEGGIHGLRSESRISCVIPSSVWAISFPVQGWGPAGWEPELLGPWPGTVRPQPRCQCLGAFVGTTTDICNECHTCVTCSLCLPGVQRGEVGHSRKEERPQFDSSSTTPQPHAHGQERKPPWASIFSHI